jgi:hypothetical protein
MGRRPGLKKERRKYSTSNKEDVVSLLKQEFSNSRKFEENLLNMLGKLIDNSN